MNARDQEFASRVDKLQVPLKIKQRQKEEDAVRIEDTEWLVKELKDKGLPQRGIYLTRHHRAI